MARLVYTIVFEISDKGVSATIPTLPGFQFGAANSVAAMHEAPERLKCFLEGLSKAGKRIPVESEFFRIDSTLIEIETPSSSNLLTKRRAGRAGQRG